MKFDAFIKVRREHVLLIFRAVNYYCFCVNIREHF